MGNASDGMGWDGSPAAHVLEVGTDSEYAQLAGTARPPLAAGNDLCKKRRMRNILAA